MVFVVILDCRPSTKLQGSFYMSKGMSPAIQPHDLYMFIIFGATWVRTRHKPCDQPPCMLKFLVLGTG